MAMQVIGEMKTGQNKESRTDPCCVPAVQNKGLDLEAVPLAVPMPACWKQLQRDKKLASLRHNYQKQFHWISVHSIIC